MDLLSSLRLFLVLSRVVCGVVGSTLFEGSFGQDSSVPLCTESTEFCDDTECENANVTNRGAGFYRYVTTGVQSESLLVAHQYYICACNWEGTMDIGSCGGGCTGFVMADSVCTIRPVTFALPDNVTASCAELGVVGDIDPILDDGLISCHDHCNDVVFGYLQDLLAKPEGENGVIGVSSSGFNDEYPDQCFCGFGNAYVEGCASSGFVGHSRRPWASVAMAVAVAAVFV